MTETKPDQSPDDAPAQSPEHIRETARAELNALEASLPTLQRALTTWGLRVVVLAVALYGVIRWQGTEMSWFLPLVAIYAAVSLAVTYLAFAGQRRAFAKRRALVEERITSAAKEGE